MEGASGALGNGATNNLHRTPRTRVAIGGVNLRFVRCCSVGRRTRELVGVSYTCVAFLTQDLTLRWLMLAFRRTAHIIIGTTAPAPATTSPAAGFTSSRHYRVSSILLLVLKDPLHTTLHVLN